MNKIKISVSVIVPAYNVEKYIEKTLKSIMNQTLKEIEIIVINDGSRDGTLSIIKRLMIEDTRIVLIDKKNGGVSRARNDGIKIAKGKYISFIDGDDWIEEEFLKEGYKYGIENDLDMVACDMSLDYFRKKKSRYHSEFKTNRIISGKEYLEFYYKNQVIRGIANKIIKKEIFIKNNLFFLENVPSGEDMNLTIKLGYVISKVGKINKAYYHYIQYPQSTTKQDSSEKMLPYLLSFDDIEFFLEKNKIENYQEEIKKIYKYKVVSIQSFPIRRANWNSDKYVKAVEKYLEVIKDKRLKDCLEDFKIEYKVLWKILKIFPKIIIFKILNFSLSWIDTLKMKIYVKFYI